MAAAVGAEKRGEERSSSRRLLKGASGGSMSLFSEAYILKMMPNCLRLFWQLLRRAASRALERAGRSIAARIPMMAMTTSNSMRVKPLVGLWRDLGMLALSVGISGRLFRDAPDTAKTYKSE